MSLAFKLINDLLFCNYIPLEKGEALSLIILEIPSTKDSLC